jgi:hypothetical protein
MTVSLSPRSKIEKPVKEDIAAMDEAIMFLRKHDQVSCADRLGRVRDFIACSEAYYRNIEAKMRKLEHRGHPLKNAEHMWLDATGRRKP